MFKIEPTVIWRSFKLLGVNYPKIDGALEIISFHSNFALCTFNEINVHIPNYNILELMKFGTFVNCLYNKQVIIVKQKNNVIAIPIDSERYQELLFKGRNKIKLNVGLTYIISVNNKSEILQYFGEWYRQHINIERGGFTSKYKSLIFLKEDGNYVFFKNKGEFFIEETIDNSFIAQTELKDVINIALKENGIMRPYFFMNKEEQLSFFNRAEMVPFVINYLKGL